MDGTDARAFAERHFGGLRSAMRDARRGWCGWPRRSRAAGRAMRAER